MDIGDAMSAGCDFGDNCPAIKIIEEYSKRMDEMRLEIRELRTAMSNLTEEMGKIRGARSAFTEWRSVAGWILMFLLYLWIAFSTHIHISIL
jgi:hypothetical protein